MSRVISHKWIRGILIGTALLAPLGYIGLRNGFAKAQVGTPITPGSSVNTPIAPSINTTTDLSVGSNIAVDTTSSPASGLSFRLVEAQDAHAMSEDWDDTHLALDADEEEADLAEIAATEEESTPAEIAEDETNEEEITVSQHDSSYDHYQTTDSYPSQDEEEYSQDEEE